MIRPAQQNIWPGEKFNTNPWRLWDSLEQIGAVTRPLSGNERERKKTELCKGSLNHKKVRGLVARTVENIYHLLRWQWLEQLFCFLNSILENPRRALGTLVFIAVVSVWPNKVLHNPCTVGKTPCNNDKTMLTKVTQKNQSTEIDKHEAKATKHA